MAGLLPFVGQDSLYNRLSFRNNWRDPANWLAAKAVIPEFLDPMYPDSTRQVVINGVPVDFGATHFVGIAGVGLDAAGYPRDDPAYIAKRGIFGYDRSATVKEVAQGRGVSNTIAIIQVPHDGPAGVTPWIAGGGATIRGVPEKNSIAPFVLTKDRNGNIITYKGSKDKDARRGTYALMADGSVRFIDQNISDDVFKAMCTIGGGAPEDFKVEGNPLTQSVPAPPKEEIKEDSFARPGSEPVKLPPGWVHYTSPDGYSVGFPQQPKELSKTYPELGAVKSAIVEMPGEQKVAFEVEVATLNAALQEKAKTLQGLREIGLMTAPPQLRALIKVGKETPVTAGPYKGLEFVATVDLGDIKDVGKDLGKIKLIATVRLFAVNDRCYNVAVMAANAPPPEMGAFFDSFRIGSVAPPDSPPGAAAAPPARAKAPPGWTSFSEPDGTFAVAFPQAPISKELDLPNVGKLTVYGVELAGKQSLTVLTAKFPAAILAQARTPDGVRKLAQLSLGQFPGLKITGEKEVTQGTYKGLELAIEGSIPQIGKLVTTTRVFVLDDRMLQLSAGGPGSMPAEAKAFFDSLVIRPAAPSSSDATVKTGPRKDPDAAVSVPVGWTTFNAPEGHSVVMPKDPEAPAKVELAGGIKVNRYVSRLDASSFITTAAKLPPLALAKVKTPDGMKQLAMIGVGSGGKLIREVPVKHGLHAGQEYVVEDTIAGFGKLVISTRVFITSDRVVAVTSIGTNEAPEETKSFFESLRLGE
jgi:hypothetical protein